MSLQDFQINASVRSILSRCWASTARLNFGTTNGVVYIRGTFLPERGPQTDGGGALLADIERDIRSLPGVRDVVVGVTGWHKVGHQWVRTASAS